MVPGRSSSSVGIGALSCDRARWLTRPPFPMVGQPNTRAEHPNRTPEPRARVARVFGSGVRLGCSARVFGWPTIGNGGRVSHRARSQERAPMPTDEEDLPGTIAVSYTHLTLPTIYS